jgi:hypothetical protein
MPCLSHWLLGLDFIRARWRQAPANSFNGVNGIDNFRSKSVSIFKDMVCNFSNPTNMVADMNIVHVDIRRIL